MIYYFYYDSPIGRMLIQSDGDSITDIDFADQGDNAGAGPAGLEKKELPVFDQARSWLDEYFSGRDPGAPPKIRAHGSHFQKEVWDILRNIPYGETMSYGDIADLIAERRGIRKMSAQAVGGAVGHNPVSIMVPCHRVIGSDGSLVGYGAGLDKKEYLLRLEGIEVER